MQIKLKRHEREEKRAMINKNNEMNCKTKQLQEVIKFLNKEQEFALAEKRRHMKTKISSTDFTIVKLSTKIGY